MTLESIVENISLANFPARIRLSTKKGGIVPNTTRLQEILIVELKTTARDDPSKPWLTSTEVPLPELTYADIVFGEIEPVLEWIWTCVRIVVQHELEEQFLYCGQRVFEPHKPEKT